MQKKIYVAGMFDGDTAKKVEDAVRAVSGVTSVTASPDKAQVLVDYADDGVLPAINAAISALGIDVLD
ncbi:heavy-metal-associated domain-containing protein [Treponema socranskii]|uniref:heavy-metal-associated domain-containing protein n=1 Tax=Treponema socranskii TaxID=53419 RepID=UPI003D8DB1A9